MLARKLSPRDRTKLVGILGMLGSDADGERANAGVLADRFLKDRGLLWSDVITPAADDTAAKPSPHAPQSIYAIYLAFARQHFALLSEKEMSVVRTLEGWDGTPTTNQVKALFSICARLRREGAR